MTRGFSNWRIVEEIAHSKHSLSYLVAVRIGTMDLGLRGVLL